jgi:CRP-like cAMP-binding protein
MAYAHTDLSEAEWLEFEKYLQLKSVAKKQLLLRVGDTPTTFGIVVSGILRVYYVHEDGKEFTKTFRRTGDYVGALAEILLDVPSRVHVEAVVDSEVLVGDFKYFKKLLEQSWKWERVFRTIVQESYLEKEQREYEFLQLSASERYENFKFRYADIVDRLPKHQIASYLGITAVALSRLSSK